MALVLDASALVWAITERLPEAVATRRRIAAEVCHAPHLVDAEVGNVLRRLVLSGSLEAGAAESLLTHGAALVDHRHAHTGGLARVAWSLRHRLTFYDGLYAALATALGAVLLTGDARLGAAPGLPYRVEVVGR